MLISSKVGLVTSANGYDRDSSFKNIMREVESSLYNLKTDHIDFYSFTGQMLRRRLPRP